MHYLQHAGVLAVLSSSLALAAPLFSNSSASNPLDISNKYIVTLKSNVSLSQHVSLVQQIHGRSRFRRSNGTDFGGVSHEYDFAGFLGYAGHFDKSVISQLTSHSDVAAIEPQQIWTTFRIIDQKHATEGLNLISHRKDLNHDDYEYDTTAGEGTYGYVVDTGINTEHHEFGGRAKNGYNALHIPFKDTAGHGTHVAGTMCSATYGVAKKCNLIAVKVFDGESGTTAAIMDGYAWAVKDIVKHRRQAKAVINMSLGGGYSTAFNSAVDKAAKQGVSTVVAAGNSGVDAQRTSPASASGAIAVAATDMHRARAKFSNYGKVVAVFAPGVGIQSTWIGSSSATKKLSGTSMASPHVAGLVLYLKDLHSLKDARSTKAYIQKLATNKVVRNAQGSPNLFAYNGSGD